MSEPFDSEPFDSESEARLLRHILNTSIHDSPLCSGNFKVDNNPVGRWTYSAVPPLTIDGVIASLQEIEASCYVPAPSIQDNGAIRRLMEKAGVVFFDCPPSLSQLMGVAIETRSYIPEGMATIRDSSGKLFIIDARTDEEKAIH